MGKGSNNRPREESYFLISRKFKISTSLYSSNPFSEETRYHGCMVCKGCQERRNKLSLHARRLLHKTNYELKYMEHELLPDMFPHPGQFVPFDETIHERSDADDN